ncbi:MAG: diiron oxygenase [Magnetovibrio sp.]|nr:diiron oxygenase [Magnetovibrio sp.]
MSRVLDRLGAHGARYRDPVAAIDWRAADDGLPWLPMDLLSIDGLDIAGRLSAEQLKRFSEIEFARLCAAGMWLEGLLISRVTAKGYLGLNTDEARIMLQEVREESGHSLMFLEMIARAGLKDVPLLGATGLLTRVAGRLDPAGPAFWAMVYIGETVTDTFGLKALKRAREPGQDICPVARQVLELHHRDEARHIAAARTLLASRIGQMTGARRLAFTTSLRFLLNRFLDATLYPTAASLAALGLDDPKGVAAAVKASPARRRLAQACAQPALDMLRRDGMLPASTEAAP